MYRNIENCTHKILNILTKQLFFAIALSGDLRNTWVLSHIQVMEEEITEEAFLVTQAMEVMEEAMVEVLGVEEEVDIVEDLEEP